MHWYNDGIMQESFLKRRGVTVGLKGRRQFLLIKFQKINLNMWMCSSNSIWTKWIPSILLSESIATAAEAAVVASHSKKVVVCECISYIFTATWNSKYYLSLCSMHVHNHAASEWANEWVSQPSNQINACHAKYASHPNNLY